MPRVHMRTRKRATVKRPMRCTGPCKLAQERDGDTEIRVGDSYYTWARKLAYGGITYFKHVQCGHPRPTQLSNRKTARIEEALLDAVWPTASFDMPADGSLPEAEAEGFLGEVTSVVEEIAAVIREVGEEYQEAFDNMPEGLNQGDTGMALESVAQEMESRADELESWEPSTDTAPDWPEREEDESDEDFAERVQQAFDDWADEVLSEAQDAVQEYPEYEG